MDIDLDDVAVFVRVVEARGFSAAARALGAPKSSVSRRVSRLEGKLGIRLLHRTTRSLTLTEAGRTYYERVSLAIAAMNDAASAAIEAREIPRGTVRITAPPDVGAEVLPDIIARFVVRYPEVQIDVDLTAEPRSLVEGGYDLALRGGAQPDSALVLRKLQDTAFRLYASPDYLARTGVPGQPGDLAGHTCVLFRARHGKQRWRLRSSRNAPDAADEPDEIVVQVSGPIVANNLSFIRRAVIAGAGIALLPELVGESIVQSGLLAGVLPKYYVSGNPLYIVYPSVQHMPLRIRAFRDFLLEHFPA
ncbi:MAG: LysR family transcriptional regulator [Myxococcota bacterium]